MLHGKVVGPPSSNAPVRWNPGPGRAAPGSSGAPPAASGCWLAGFVFAALAGP